MLGSESARPFVWPAPGIAILSLILSVSVTDRGRADQETSERPNILLIMADDLGYETLGCYGGSSYRTPNLDKLAKSGIRFDNCYSTPKCSPSRVTIMTGRYTFRTTMKWGHIPDEEITFGSVLAFAGYRTALAGKWQMALIKDKPNHVAQKGFMESCVWAWHEGPRYWKPMIYQNGKLLRDASCEYGPDVYTAFLIDFMSTAKDEPFLAYYPMCLVHGPKGDEPKGPSGRKETYRERVELMDKKIGQLVEALEKLGLREETLILFTADNGSPVSVTSHIGDKSIRGGKGKLTDAGTHVPLIASWPGTAPAGTCCEDLIDFSDFMPTLCELASAKLPDVRIDGRSFTAQLRGKRGKPREWIYTEFGGRAWARTKRWKLYRSGELFDMVRDPGESAPVDFNQVVESQAARANLQSVLDKLEP